MPRRIARMLRYREEWRDGGIRLAGPQLQIGVLGIPTSDSGVMLCNGLQSISTRGTRRVRLQMVLENLLFDGL
jgi:hypothetical protein